MSLFRLLSRLQPKRYSGVAKALIIAAIVLSIAGIITGLIFLIAYIFMALWNWLMPDIFGLKTISILQAVGLIFLAKILFGAFEGNRGSSQSSHHSRHHHDHAPPKHPWPPSTSASAPAPAAPATPAAPPAPDDEAGAAGSWPGSGSEPGPTAQWQQYWQEEGKTAFEAWLRKKGIKREEPENGKNE